LVNLVLKVKIQAIILLAGVALGLAGTVRGQGVTGGFAVDISDREAVRAFYNSVYGHRANVRAEWTGSVSNCVAGTTSPEYKDAVLTRVNFYRAMAGVPASVTFNDSFSLRVQETALIMSANDEISHYPVEGWLCFSDWGAEGARNSNLAIGNAGMDSVDSYIIDAGPNYRVGHRRWVIFPNTRLMGTGDVDPPDGSQEQPANALWVFDDYFYEPRPATRESFVAWPPPGFVPHQLVYPRWSFQISKADFSGAIVTMTSNGVPVAVRQEKVEDDYGENGVVWVPHDILPQTRMFWPKPDRDVVYSVQVENVGIGGVATNFSYNVVVFDPETPEGAWAEVKPAGPPAPAANRINRYSAREYPRASGYDLRYGRLTNDLAVLTAEDGEIPVIKGVSGLYPFVQTDIAATGAAAFRLAHSRPLRIQWFMLGETIVPSSASELRFNSRLGGASWDEFARVEVSLDEGSSWREIYAQAGDGTAGELVFVPRSLSLSRFAGRAIWIRFNFGLAFGPSALIRGLSPGIGWYIDDIEVTAAQRLAASELLHQEGPEFEFIPPAPGEYYLDARPRYYQDYTGEWSLGSWVNAMEPAPTVLSMKSIVTSAGADFVFEVAAFSLPPKATLHVEHSATLNGDWKRDSSAELTLVENDSRFRATVKKVDDGAGFYRVVAEP
jgi:hypothetical protein